MKKVSIFMLLALLTVTFTACKKKQAAITNHEMILELSPYDQLTYVPIHTKSKKQQNVLIAFVYNMELQAFEQLTFTGKSWDNTLFTLSLVHKDIEDQYFIKAAKWNNPEQNPFTYYESFIFRFTEIPVSKVKIIESGTGKPLSECTYDEVNKFLD
jgi:hypothetical protein